MVKIFLLIAITLLAGACSERQSPEEVSPYGTCKRPGQAVIIIDLRESRPGADPPNACASPGQNLRFNIVPPPKNTGTVGIVANRSNPDGGGQGNWLTQRNNGNAGLIEVTVPEKTQIIKDCGKQTYDKGECYFDYSIHVDGENPVDPRVTVRR